MTRQITVGKVKIGGGAPVTVQSMCTTDTRDVASTVAQIVRLHEAGCEIVRAAVPDIEAARAVKAIKQASPLPVVADIHFDYTLALEALKSGADKIRINPGNIGSAERVRAVADACRERGVPIRIGVNSGSVERGLLDKHGGPTPAAIAESALGELAVLEGCAFFDVCLSVKCSNAKDTVEAYRIVARERPDVPLHLGVTHAGSAYTGTISSAVAIGALLMDGIGDTIRVSLTADPVEEVRAGVAILRAAGLRPAGVRVVSCPTCGRTVCDVGGLARAVEETLTGERAELTVAVMGCVVNGPGEGREADIGVTGGNEGFGLLFRKGRPTRKVRTEDLLAALLEEVEDVKIEKHGGA